MNKSLKIGLVFFVFLLIFIAVFETNRKKPINWNETYSYKDKIPFGSYVLYKELKNIFSYPENTYRIEEPLYEFLETYYSTEDSLSPNFEQQLEENYSYYSSIFCLNSDFEFDKPITKQLTRFAEDGGSVFISTYNLNQDFLDSLGVKTEYFSDFNCKTKFETPKFSLTKNNKILKFDKEESGLWFSKLPKDAEILGYFHREDVKVPYFIRIPKGDGYFYLHLEPKIFTNYYLLKKEHFAFACQSLYYLNGEKIAWYDGDASETEESTPLLFILSNKSLRFAWYILLFGLILYLIFKSKREQRFIPIVEPEENKSVQFAKVISSLYYERGTPENMVRKKIEYFLFHLRNRYLINTLDLQDSKFHKILSEKSGKSLEEVTTFFTIIHAINGRNFHSEDDLIELNRLIEEFER